MIDPRPVLMAALLLALASPALAQDDGVVATAAGAAGSPSDVEGVIATRSAAPPAPPMTTDQKIANILSASWSEDQALNQPAEVGPRQIHGEAGVSVGSDGYRAAYVSALIPVGERGTVGVAYSQSQGGRRFIGGPGYGDYGYGYGGRTRGANGTSESLGLSFNFDASNPRSDNCAPAFRDDGRAMDPAWATQMRGGRSACAAANDPSRQ